MKKKSSIIVVIITASLTFGTLFAVKGGIHRHHGHYYSNHCIKAVQQDNKNDCKFEKTEEKSLEKSSK